MTQQDAFLRAILTTPADDLARLVYADLLEENGGEAVCGCKGGQVYEMGEGRDGIYRNHWTDHKRCHGTGHVSNGFAERAEFIRSSIAVYRGEPLTDRVMSLFWSNCKKWFGLGEIGPTMWRATFDSEGAWAFVSRGFVSEVRLTLAAFLGGPCERCDGFGNDFQGGRTGFERCPTCSGTGRTKGLAKSIFAAHPVERVVLTDREPEESGLYPGMYRWYTDNENNERSEIPEEIYRLLKGEYPTHQGLKSTQPYWRSADDARSALSAACVAYGRELVVLPPLQVEVLV